jgi:hypothetical protein
MASCGFYHRGGGEVMAEIYPTKQVNSLRLLDRGKVIGLTGCSAVGNLSASSAKRQRNAVLVRIADCLKPLEFHVRIELWNARAIKEVPSLAPHNGPHNKSKTITVIKWKVNRLIMCTIHLLKMTAQDTAIEGKFQLFIILK